MGAYFIKILTKTKKEKATLMASESELNADGSAPGTSGMKRSLSSKGPLGSSGVGATTAAQDCQSYMPP